MVKTGILSYSKTTVVSQLARYIGPFRARTDSLYEVGFSVGFQIRAALSACVRQMWLAPLLYFRIDTRIFQYTGRSVRLAFCFAMFQALARQYLLEYILRMLTQCQCLGDATTLLRLRRCSSRNVSKCAVYMARQH
jgi:hypothetical protein